MKKTIAFVLALLMTLWTCSCKNNQEEKNDLDHIYEVDDHTYQFDTESFNHRNTISDVPERKVDANMPLTKNIYINNKEYNLKYAESLHYPIGDKILNMYLVDGNEKQKILLNPDGSISAMLYDFEKLDIQPTSSPATVRSLLEPKLQNVIDLTKYQNVNMPTSDENQSETGEFGIYDFLYYNSVDGYMTDYTKVSVDKNGNIFGLSINDLGKDDLDLNLDKEKEKELLVAKLKDIYNTDTTEYKSYEEVYPPQVVIYNGEICIQYYVSVMYVDSTGGELSDWILPILIPVHIITIHSK